MPAVVHQLHGNASKKPQAELANAQSIDVMLPEPPAYLSDLARAEWERIGPHLVTLGLIGAPYLAALAGYCTAYADWIRARRWIEQLQAAEPSPGSVHDKGYVAGTPGGYKQISAHLVVADKAEERMLRWAAQFGLTPATRMRAVGAGTGQGALFPDSDPMAAFVAAARGLSGAA